MLTKKATPTCLDGMENVPKMGPQDASTVDGLKQHVKSSQLRAHKEMKTNYQ